MKRNQTIIALLLFSISFGIYLKTLAPTVTGGDSGELLTDVYILGITHPPGHPLYCLLGRLFTFLPFGSVVYRVNMMSAFFASLTIIFVYLIVLKIQNTGKPANWQTDKPFTSHLPAIIASLCLAFSKSLWRYALRAEIYTLQAFCLALLILLLLQWKDSHDLRPATSDRQPATGNRYLYLFALIYGLSFSNHTFMALFFPAFLYIIVATDRRQILKFKSILLMLLLFLLGLVLYLYLPIRSLVNPPLDWGDPENLQRFIYHVTGQQFAFRLFDLPLNKIPAQIRSYSCMLLSEFTWLPLSVGLIGLGCLMREKRRFLLFTGLIFLANLVFSLSSFTIKSPAHHFIPSYLVFSLWIGYGMGFLFRFLYSRFSGMGIGIYLASFLLLLLPLVPASIHYQEVDKSRDYEFYEQARNILEAAEEGTILIGGDTFTFWYLKYVEGRRSDIIELADGLIAHRYPWYLGQLQRRYPQLAISCPQSEIGKGPIIKGFLRDKEFIYPVNQKIKEAWEALEKEGGGDSKRSPQDIVKSAVTWYLIRHNLDEHPIYLFERDELALPSQYYLSFRGLYYEISKKEPRLVVENPRIENEVGANFSDKLLLLGYNIDRTALFPGDPYRITYYWKILRKPKKPPKIVVLFVDEEGNYEVKEGKFKFHQVHYLGYGLPPNYEKGQTIAEEYHVMVPSDISPGRYNLHLGILDEEEDQALLVKSPARKGEILMITGEPFVKLGSIEVLSRGK
ncbi:DUF2723 domain-containing protein [bacterium]|nr:DUF2723 domain-containing protein [bacterium]